jgi:hypothetical protein
MHAHKLKFRTTRLFRYGPCVLATIVVLHLALLSGCSTFDPTNAAERPWNRPTREEVVDDRLAPEYQSWFRPTAEQPIRRPGDHYP